MGYVENKRIQCRNALLCRRADFTITPTFTLREVSMPWGICSQDSNLYRLDSISRSQLMVDSSLGVGTGYIWHHLGVTGTRREKRIQDDISGAEMLSGKRRSKR